MLAAHPLFTYPITLALFRPRHAPVALIEAEGARPSLAICMCAYNEEDVIAAKVERLIEMAEAYGPATIHVYADCPADNTASILSRYADRIDLVIGTERAGKTFGMNRLVARSDSEYLMFTDANVESDVDAAIELARPLADPTIGCTTARLVYSNRGESPTSALGAIYWAMEERIKQLESRTTGLIGCDGAMFMMRRSLHRPPPPHLIDDLFLSLNILIERSRIVSVPHVKVFERSATGAVEEKRRKQRIACQAINVHSAMWPRLRRMPALSLYAYISHRPMKWLMPFFLAGAALSCLLLVALTLGPVVAALVAAASALVIYVGERFRLKPFSLLSSAVLSLAGVGVGVYESVVLKKTYTTWDPALSVRLVDTDDFTPAPSRSETPPPPSDHTPLAMMAPPPHSGGRAGSGASFDL
jgi:cellulose synthase/poly-beta-1,6-N-acetylglucosamine synthase-like glycosyltransferase